MKTYNTIFESEEQIREFFSNIPKKENLVQIFSGIVDKDKIKEVIELVKKYYPIANIIGSTTDGEIIGSKVTSKKIVISVTTFDKAKVKTLLMQKDKRSFEMGREFAKAILTPDAKVLIAFADGLNINGEEFLKGIDSNIIVAGGLAGDNGEFKETLVFDRDSVVSNGVVGAVIEGDIFVNKEFSFNWEGVGKQMRVTKAIKNRVYEIDGKKAAEIYRHYLGDVDIVKIGIQFPLIVQKEDLKLARAVIGEREDGSLIFAGNINEGDIVQLGFGEVSSILQRDNILLDKMSNYEVESIFIYSCMARRRFLGKFIEKEIEPFAQIAPVSGFFTYGEFFTASEKVFFNETMTLLILSENRVKKEIEHKIKEEATPFKALTRLIKVTSEELNELNSKLEEAVEKKSKEIIEKNKKLEYMYYHDQLTLLKNRNKMEEDLQNYEIFGALLVDIKGFSKINDLYGEIVGDSALKSVADRLKTLESKDVKLYRVGADQFIFIAYKEVDLYKLKETIFDVFKDLISVNVDNTYISLDIDVRVSMVKGNFKDIKVKADLALAFAKKEHKDFIEYKEELQLEKRLEDEIKVLEMVKEAIREDRVVPVFQKIDKEKEITYECLVRIKEGNRLISPYYFLDVIKPTSYYFEITKIMIDKSMRIFKDRKENISLNFSFQDIANQEIVDYLIEKVKKYKMQGRVIVELLESENIEDFEVVKKFIERVRKEGIKIAIDDFGSGYSNFVYLAQLDPEFLKIDGSIIKNLHEDKNLYIITKHINAFAKEIGCKTIAEFVSNEDIYKKVKEIGVDGVQGYFIDEPKELK